MLLLCSKDALPFPQVENKWKLTDWLQIQKEKDKEENRNSR
jgi:hypothetical protein